MNTAAVRQATTFASRRILLALVTCATTINACSDGPSNNHEAGSDPKSAAPLTRADVDAMLPVVQFDGETSDMQVPLFGTPGDDGQAQAPANGFQPSAFDEVFCWAVDSVNRRPQPRDDFEEVVVAHQYLTALQPLVPPELADELALLLRFTGRVVEQGSFGEGDEAVSDDGVFASVATITDFVDERCLGI